MKLESGRVRAQYTVIALQWYRSYSSEERMASEELNNSIRKPSARRSKPDMAALVDQQRFFESLWSRKPILQLDSLVPVVTLHDLEINGVNLEHVSPPSSSYAEKRFQEHLLHSSLRTIQKDRSVTIKHDSRHNQYDGLEVDIARYQSTSFSSSGDSDITQNNTNSVIKIDEDDDLPLSTFLPLKSIPLTNNSNNNDHSMNHKDEIVHPLCQCTKPAVLDDPRWDGQFCSPECLIRVCHEAFNVWLENHHCVKEDTVIEH